MRYVFLINPKAGKGMAESIVRPSAESYFSNTNLDFRIYVTSKPGEAAIIAKKEAETGEDITLFACGGDGTVFEVLNGMVGYPNAVLGVIPVGSANDFLKYYKNEDKAAFLDIADQLAGTAKAVDLIKCGDEYCLNLCSAGMDAVVGDGMKKFKNIPFVSGPMAYQLSIVRTFLGKLGTKMRISIDGKFFAERDYLFAVCANGPCYGGGYRCAPKADPFDGHLDYVIVNKISKLKILTFLGKYKRGDIEDLECCSIGRCSEIDLESDQPFPISMDGEIRHHKHIKFSIVRAGARILIPASISKNINKFKTIVFST